MSEQVGFAIFWYCCAILALALLYIAMRQRPRLYTWLDPMKPPNRRGIMDTIPYIAAWCILGSLLFATSVDIVIWVAKSDMPSVSDIIHYTFWKYPYLGWIAAGICYHLLVDRPHVPWGS